MFDNINYEAPCPNCNELLNDWQSKDGPCVLEILEPWEVKAFYTSCPKCGAWVEATVDADVEHIVKKCDISLRVDHITSK